MATKEQLQEFIQKDQQEIERLKAEAVQRVQQINAELNNAIGRCEGRIGVYQETLAELDKVEA